MRNNYLKFASDIRSKHQFVLLMSFLLMSICAVNTFAESTVVFYDNFDRGTSSAPPPPGGTPMMTWNTFSTLGANARLVTLSSSNYTGRVFQIWNNSATADSTGTNGQSYMTGALSTFLPAYKSVLKENPADVTWTVNMRNSKTIIRPQVNGLLESGDNNYAQLLVLVASGENLLANNTSGYAVALSRDTVGTTIFKLVRFQQGLGATENLTTIIESEPGVVAATYYASVKVVYSPQTDTWKLFVRDDKGNFALPDPMVESETVGYYTEIGQGAVDNTYTSLAMSVCGFFYNHGTARRGTEAKANFDNFGVQVAAATLSAEARLNEINIDKDGEDNYVPLTKFNADKYSYTYYLTKYHAEIPSVSAVKFSAVAFDPVVVNATSLTGTQEERTTTITVTAEDGTSTKVYSIEFVKTDYLFIGGLTPTGGSTPPAGWKSTQMFFSADNAGNDKYQGSSYARCISTSTASNLTLPKTRSVGTLKFFARKIHADVIGNISVSVKIDEGDWVQIADLGDITSMVYQEYQADVNLTSVDSIFVRLNVTKNGDVVPSAGYYFDDFAYTEASGTNVENVYRKAVFNIRDAENGFSVDAQDARLTVFNISGQLIADKMLNGTETIYPQAKGLYVIHIVTPAGRGSAKYIVR